MRRACLTVTAVAFGACVQIIGDDYGVDGGAAMRRDPSLGGAGRARRAESGSGAAALDSSNDPQAADTPDIQADAGASVPASPAADGMMSVPQVPTGALGSPCVEAADCDNGQCVRNVCCGSPACGVCEICGATGACEKITNAFDPVTCPGESSICDATGACALADGASCGPPNGLPCASGICDAFCCSVACGRCQQCGQSGVCEPLAFGDDELCVGSHSCSGGECAEIDQAFTEPNFDLTFSAGEMLAQTVTVNKTGKLVEVRLNRGCGRTLSLREVNSSGVPADITLKESIRSTVHLDGLTESFEFDLDVGSGNRLAIVLRNDQGSDCSVPVSMGNPYLGGALLSWNADDGTWSAVANNDMAFKLLLVH